MMKSGNFPCSVLYRYEICLIIKHHPLKLLCVLPINRVSTGLHLSWEHTQCQTSWASPTHTQNSFSVHPTWGATQACQSDHLLLTTGQLVQQFLFSHCTYFFFCFNTASLTNQHWSFSSIHPEPPLTENGSRPPFILEGLDRHLLQCSTLLFGSCYEEDITDTLYQVQSSIQDFWLDLSKHYCSPKVPLFNMYPKIKGLKCNFVFLDRTSQGRGPKPHGARTGTNCWSHFNSFDPEQVW